MADGQVVIQVKSNAKEAARDFDKLDKSLDSTEKELKQVDSAADKADGSIISLKGAAIGLAGAFATVQLGQFSKELVNIASDAEETANKFSVVFSSIQSDAEAAAQSLATNFGLAGDEAQKFLSDTGDLLTGFGFTQEAALDLSVQLNSLAVDLASFTNVEGGTERATAALTSALFGETEAAKSLGIVITQDVVKAKVKALEATGRLTDETDNEKRAIATLALAYEQSKNAIGDFARSQDSFANQTRIAEANVRDLKTALGNELLPVATSAVGIFNDLAGALKTAFAATRDERLRQIAFDLNEASLELKEFTNTFNNSFLRSFDGLDAAATPAFAALQERIRALKEEQQSLLGTGGTEQPEVAIAAQDTSAIDTQIQKQNELTEAIKETSTASEDFKTKSVESFDFAGSAASNFARNATSFITDPYEEGETAADRFKDIAIESIKDILVEFLAAELQKQAAAALTAVLTGGASLFGGAASGAVTASAKGNAFNGGSVQAFANGGAFTNGIVSSPTTFPMSGGRTGLMGEAGPEAIMPLDRDNTGRLGVQVTQAPVNVNVVNNAPVQIQTVSRPDNEFDIIVENVNAALSDSRTNNGVSLANGRFTQRGQYGA